MTDTVNDWHNWTPEAKAILEAAANMFYGGDIERAAKVGIERWHKTTILPTPFEAVAEAQLSVVKHPPKHQ